MKQKTTFLYILICTCISVYAELPQELRDFPKGSEPSLIASKLAQRYIATEKGTGYPHVCTWFGALRFAAATTDKSMLSELEKRFDSNTIPKADHVDRSVFGVIPFQLYIQTGKEEYLDWGLYSADRQWAVPDDVNPNNRPKYEALQARGLSWQTRFWIDDMYMITSVQSQAYLATNDVKYINRAAYEMTVYLDSIQCPNGLFHHEKTAPFFWGRGNGWMAAGMADLLSHLPENNPDRLRILQEYRKMMATLKSYQNEEGLWNQLIDEPDVWTETSGSAMFTYAMITGVKNGWLDAKEYAPIARKAWLALLTYLNDDWALREVCVGTNIGYTKEYYVDRPRSVGDLHGQAALLWCAVALYDTNDNSTASLNSLFYDYGTLSPAFNPEITEYTCFLPAGVAHVTPRLTTSYGAGLAGAGMVNVSSGSEISTITVTSIDGLTTRSYTVHFVVGNDEDYTNLILNNDFELAPDVHCNPVPVAPGIDGWDPSSHIFPAWRLLNSSCVAKQFYGWTHDQSLLGNSASQGINADGTDKHGNWVAWIGGNKAGYTEFEFSQTIDKALLTAGTYKVQCLLAVGKGDKKNNQRMFVNNQALYYGRPSDYVGNLVEGEEYAFADHTSFVETELKEMTIYTTLTDDESLKMGIRTSNKKGNGSVTSTQMSPMFKVDYFRLTKLDPTKVADATLAHIGLSIGSLDFSPEKTTYNILLPIETETVTAVATANLQDVVVSGEGTVDVSSGSGVSILTVTALDGKTTRTYTINYTVEGKSGLYGTPVTKSSYSITNGKLTVDGADAYVVYNLSGIKIADIENNTSGISVDLPPGAYIVKTKMGEAFKIIVK